MPASHSHRDPSRRLRRTLEVFEFIVRSPWSESALRGYRRAARHFGYHTAEDPTFAGSDASRLLIHRSAAHLRAVVRRLRDTPIETDDDFLALEVWLGTDAGVHYFGHDWKHWDPEQDLGALEGLGWQRRIRQVQFNSQPAYRVTLRASSGRVARPRSRRLRRRQRPRSHS